MSPFEQAKLSELYDAIGPRYRRCSFDNYRIYSDADFDSSVKPNDRTRMIELQGKFLEHAKRYAAGIAKAAEEAINLLYLGAKGTGKDHLVLCVARAAFEAGYSVKWFNGPDLFGEIRDTIGTNKRESKLIEELIEPDFLWISDPAPVSGTLTEFQQAFLFRVIDARYRSMKPVWMTANVKTSSELEQSLGQATTDRVRDGAVYYYCNWPSHRHSRKMESVK